MSVLLFALMRVEYKWAWAVILAQVALSIVWILALALPYLIFKAFQQHPIVEVTGSSRDRWYIIFGSLLEAQEAKRKIESVVSVASRGNSTAVLAKVENFAQSVTEELERLASLKTSEVVQEEEFQTLK